MNRKILYIIPFVLLSGILAYTWYVLILNNYSLSSKHIIGLALFIVNAVAYLFKLKYGVYLTCIYLVLASFNIVAFFPEISSSSYYIRFRETEISTPSIQWKSVLLLGFFFLCAGRYMQEVYIQERKKKM